MREDRWVRGRGKRGGRWGEELGWASGGVDGGEMERRRGRGSECLSSHNLGELHVNLPRRVSWREIRMSDRRSHDCCE